MSILLQDDRYFLLLVHYIGPSEHPKYLYQISMMTYVPVLSCCLTYRMAYNDSTGTHCHYYYINSDARRHFVSDGNCSFVSLRRAIYYSCGWLCLCKTSSFPIFHTLSLHWTWSILFCILPRPHFQQFQSKVDKLLGDIDCVKTYIANLLVLSKGIHLYSSLCIPPQTHLTALPTTLKPQYLLIWTHLMWQKLTFPLQSKTYFPTLIISSRVMISSRNL